MCYVDNQTIQLVAAHDAFLLNAVIVRALSIQPQLSPWTTRTANGLNALIPLKLQHETRGCKQFVICYKCPLLVDRR